MSDTPQNVAGYVALTFDDGPSGHTRRLLEALQGCGARATVFNTGENAAANPDLVRAEVDAGMWVGNHSYNHPHMPTMSAAQMRDKLARTQAAIAAGGAETPRLFRPPYGDTNETLEAVAVGLGMRVVMWDIDSNDWDGATTEAILADAGRLQAGQVMLMHDGYETTVAAIPLIVANLARRGLLPGRIDPSTGRVVAPRPFEGGSAAD